MSRTDTRSHLEDKAASHSNIPFVGRATKGDSSKPEIRFTHGIRW